MSQALFYFHEIKLEFLLKETIICSMLTLYDKIKQKNYI